MNKHKDLNYSLSLWSLTSSSTGNDEPIEAYDNYNESTEIFVCAFSNEFARSIENQNQSGRNDGVDLYHLIYLNEGDTLVSSDKKQIQYIKDLKTRFDFNIEAKLVSEF